MGEITRINALLPTARLPSANRDCARSMLLLSTRTGDLLFSRIVQLLPETLVDNVLSNCTQSFYFRDYQNLISPLFALSWFIETILKFTIPGPTAFPKRETFKIS